MQKERTLRRSLAAKMMIFCYSEEEEESEIKVEERKLGCIFHSFREKTRKNSKAMEISSGGEIVRKEDRV